MTSVADMIPKLDIGMAVRKPVLPERQLMKMGAVICVLGSLAWDYAETCRDIAAQMGIPETRRLSRAVRELHEDYSRLHRASLSDADIKKETDLGLLFEQLCERHLRKLNHGIASEDRNASINDDYLMLVKAVQMAMAVMDAMRLYAAECDRWIMRHGVYAHSILPDHFKRLAVLLPEFAGDCYNKDSESRRITARALLNELKTIDIYDEYGKV